MARANAVKSIDARIDAGISTCIAFANSNLLNLAAADRELRRALTGFLILNDGLATDIAARIIHGRRFPANLNGTDFVPYYLTNTSHRHRIFLVGGRPGVAEQAAKIFQQQFCGRHLVVGAADGFTDISDSDRLLASMADSQADLLLVALGNPKQELWLDRHMARSNCRLAFGVGALLDFTAGRIKRAPVGVRFVRMEWAYRLLLEPKRLARRYIVEAPIFIARALMQRMSRSIVGGS